MFFWPFQPGSRLDEQNQRETVLPQQNLKKLNPQEVAKIPTEHTLNDIHVTNITIIVLVAVTLTCNENYRNHLHLAQVF